MTAAAKAKATKIFLTIGIIFLVLGFIPGLISYKLGIVVFLFSLVGVFAVKIAIPKAEEPPADQQPPTLPPSAPQA
jgi:hypothetical protein